MKYRNIMKSALCLALCASMAVTPAAGAETTTEQSNFAEEFAGAVEKASGLWSRWWFGDGDLSYEAIYKDMKNLADEGIVRIEVAKSFVWTDSEEHMNAFYYVLKAAAELGMKLDFATGNPYPAVTGTSVLEVNGKEYYNPDDIAYNQEKCDVKSMNYAVKTVGDGLDGANTLSDVAMWVSAGFFGSELKEGQEVAVNTENGEKIFAVTASYIAADGTTILGSVDLTDNDQLIRYTDVNSLHESATATLTADDLKALLDEKELAAVEENEGGTWKLFTFYTAKQTNTVCYLSYYSTRVWTQWFEKAIIDNDAYWTEVLGLAAGEVRSLFETVGTGLWEDSLEAINISYTDYAGVDENGNDYDIFALFNQVNGYEFPTERLVTLFVGGGSNYAMSGGFSKDADYVCDSVMDKQLRDDYYKTLTTAYS